MNFFKLWGSFMMQGAKAHAQWEIQMSANILGSRKRVAMLLMLLVPIILVGIVFAEQMGGAIPDILGGKKAYSPAFYSTGIFIVSILIGMGAGPDHRLHRRRRRFHHRPGPDERRHQRHPGRWHGPVSHFRQGDHGQHHPPETGQCVRSAGRGFSHRCHYRGHRRRASSTGCSTRSTRSLVTPLSPPSTPSCSDFWASMP